MNKLKRLAALALSLAMVFTMGMGVWANSATPEYDPIANVFYANGTPITIEDSNGSTVVTWNDGRKVIGPEATIFGGGKPGTSYPSSSITMNGGSVHTIFGGGQGTKTEDATVGSTSIVFNGGRIDNCIYGGGQLSSTVNTSNIVMNGGTAQFVSGGGAATAGSVSVGTADNPAYSPCRVDQANVTLNGGSVPVGLFGGGQGYSSTGSSRVVMNNGNASYVTAGGSNGYTGSSTVAINGGNAAVVQSVNRGSMDSASLIVNGGNIDNLYLAGEIAPDTTAGTIGSVTARVAGGTVEQMLPGQVGSNEITKDNTQGVTLSVTYNPNVVQNSNSLQDSFPAGSAKADPNLKPLSSGNTISSGSKKRYTELPRNWWPEIEKIRKAEAGETVEIELRGDKVSAQVIDEAAGKDVFLAVNHLGNIYTVNGQELKSDPARIYYTAADFIKEITAVDHTVTPVED